METIILPRQHNSKLEPWKTCSIGKAGWDFEFISSALIPVGMTKESVQKQSGLQDLNPQEAIRRLGPWFQNIHYHLRYPLLAIDIVSDKVKRLLVLQTMMMPGMEVADVPEDLHFHDRERMHDHGFPKMAFIEHKLAGDPTNWWVVNHACMEAMLRSANLEPVSHPLEETYVCKPAPGWRAMNRLLPTIRTEAPN